MGKTLYLEGRSGISGDMTVAALLDLGANAEKLDSVLKSLNVEGFHYEIGRRKSCGVNGAGKTTAIKMLSCLTRPTEGVKTMTTAMSIIITIMIMTTIMNIITMNIVTTTSTGTLLMSAPLSTEAL